jgi:hypothetical protein
MSTQPPIRFSSNTSYAPKYLFIHSAEPKALPPTTSPPMNSPPIYPQASPLTTGPAIMPYQTTQEAPTPVSPLLPRSTSTTAALMPQLLTPRTNTFMQSLSTADCLQPQWTRCSSAASTRPCPGTRTPSPETPSSKRTQTRRRLPLWKGRMDPLCYLWAHYPHSYPSVRIGSLWRIRQQSCPCN